MPAAVVLLNVEGRETNRIAETIAGFAGVSEVYSVAGNYDLVVVLRVKTNEELADVVTEKIRAVPGILSSQTLIAFRVCSDHAINAVLEME